MTVKIVCGYDVNSNETVCPYCKTKIELEPSGHVEDGYPEYLCPHCTRVSNVLLLGYKDNDVEKCLPYLSGNCDQYPEMGKHLWAVERLEETVHGLDHIDNFNFVDENGVKTSYKHIAGFYCKKCNSKVHELGCHENHQILHDMMLKWMRMGCPDEFTMDAKNVFKEKEEMRDSLGALTALASRLFNIDSEDDES